MIADMQEDGGMFDAEAAELARKDLNDAIGLLAQREPSVEALAEAYWQLEIEDAKERDGQQSMPAYRCYAEDAEHPYEEPMPLNEQDNADELRAWCLWRVHRLLELAGTAPQVAEPPLRDGWTYSRNVLCVECPGCAFTFDAAHEDDTPAGGYSCANCHYGTVAPEADTQEER